MAIRINLNPYKTTKMFSYLRRTVMKNNSDWAALYRNLSKDHRIWRVVAKVLIKTGKPIKTRAMMFKAVVQEVILYGI